MNRVILFEHERIDNDTFVIEDRYRLDHVGNHLKRHLGDQLKVTVNGSGIGTAEIIEEKPELLKLKITNQLETPEHRELHFYVATSRPPTIKKVIEHGTTQGVSHFHFFTADLSEKSYLTSKVFNENKMKELATLGLAQAGDLWKLPSFSLSPTLTKALENLEGESYLLTLREGRTLLQEKMTLTKRMNFFIGPERGWSGSEEILLRQKGLKPLRLSNHILRVENATLALLSQLEMIALQS